MQKHKSLGQVFTPTDIVEYMLNMVGYTGDITKSVFEPSFGDGAFLCAIFKRMLNYCRTKGMSDDTIVDAIDANLYGNELDVRWYTETRETLQKIAKEFGISKEFKFPNITNGDTLKLIDYYGKFDYIIGNPPYIKSASLSDNMQEHLNKLMLCDGNSDMYMYFYEFCMNCLKSDGKEGNLIFITPRTFMHSDSGKAFRRYIIRNNYIQNLVDYGSEKVFEDADVYVAILHLNTLKASTKFNVFTGVESKLPELPLYVLDTKDYDEVKATSSWNFAIDDKVKDCEKDIALGDICDITSGISIPNQGVFVQKGYYRDSEYILFHGCMVENALIKPIIKGSAYTSMDDYDSLLFPYYLDEENNCYVKYTDEELKEKFPRAARYIEYSQNLALAMGTAWNDWHGTIPKDAFIAEEGKSRYIFKHVFGDNVKNCVLSEIPDGVGVYSGIVVKLSEGKLAIKQVIESAEFIAYLRNTSRVMAGNYIVAGVTGIRAYKPFTVDEWEAVKRLI